MNEESEPSFQVASEKDPENTEKETPVSNTIKDDTELFEKKQEKFSEVQEDISLGEIFGSTNGVNKKLLTPEVLEEVSTSEPKDELQTEKNDVLLEEVTSNNLAQESNEVISKEKIDMCINSNKETIKEANTENNFSVLNDLQNRENKMSNLAQEKFDNDKNVKRTVQTEEAEPCVEAATIVQCEEIDVTKGEKILFQCEKAAILNECLTKNQTKNKSLSEIEESTTECTTFETIEMPLQTESTTVINCQEIVSKSVSNQNEKIMSSETEEPEAAQVEEIPSQVKEAISCSEGKIMENKSISSHQNDEVITPQAEGLRVQSENLEIKMEEESINQIDEILVHKENLTESEKEEESKTEEISIEDSLMADNEDSEKVLKEEENVFQSVSESIVHSDNKSNCEDERETKGETANINEATASVQQNNEEINCDKNESCSNILDLNTNSRSENLKQSKNKETTSENQKTSSEETVTENKSEEAKEDIHESFKVIDFIDLGLEQTDSKKTEQIQSGLESQSLTESVSGSELVQSDIHKDSQDDNDPPGGSREDLSLSGAGSSNSFDQNKEKNDSLQELISSQINVNISNISSEQEEEENNSSKSENESTEVMDTEIVNCNEFENVDLNENDMQKEKEIDRIGVESSDVDLKNEEKREEMIVDPCESVEKINLIESKEDGSIQDEPMLIDEQFDHPGHCENETITGDACSQPSVHADDEEEDICIIPDDGTPKVSILPQNKSKKKEETNDNNESIKFSAKKIKTRTPEGEKVRLRSEDKNSETAEPKTRPVRNAAKLAGNKIKSLVLNDMVVDENSLSNNVKGEVSANNQEMHRECAHCKEVKLWKFLMVQGNRNKYLCSEQCSEAFAKANQLEENFSEAETSAGEFSRKCAQCHSKVTINDKSLFWETMDFCNEDCLGKYQTELGSNCANCKGNVASISLGKYCVRFGSDVKQFCSATCLEEYKKGLKVCSYCQKDISTGTEGFLAPVGDKGQFKDFCTQFCMEKYERMCNCTPQPDVVEECAVCSNSKPVRVEVELNSKTHKLCSEPCFAAFKFVNNITEGQCDMCRKYFDRIKIGNFSVFHDETLRSFCCKTCMNVYILANRKIVPCNWCKVKKYNFDMIKKVSATGQLLMMCSLNCLMLYQASVNAVCSRRVKCDFCMSLAQAQYHLTMSDATIRNFCSYTCVMSFQVMKKKLDFGTREDRSNIILEFFAMRYKNNRYPKQAIDLISGADQLNSPIPTGGPKRVSSLRAQVDSPCVPVISSVQSLAPPNASGIPSGRVPLPLSDVNMMTQVTPLQQPLTIPTTVEIGNTAVTPMPAPPPQIYQQIITKPPPAKQMKNKSILCKPYSHTKGVSCRPHPCLKDTQTDQTFNRKCLIPIPVPIYVPTPMHMFATPFPVPVPFPLPVPVPIFIPTTRNSAKGIFKEIKKIQEKIPTDPFEAELLMMAEMVAGEKKQDPTDSESEDGNEGDDNGDETFSPENVDTSNTFGDDMLQMALKMASELEEPAVDMESVLTSNTITTSTQPPVDPNKALYDQVNVMSMNRGRKRSVRGGRNSTGGTPSKRGRRTSGSVDVPLLPPPEPVPPPRIEVEKPDANMCLKYTFGVNAWRHWVMQKNAELEKAALTNRKIKLFKPELLQLTADELNFSLCLFVKEVRKPNGTEYAPDTIYYLCLGIQQYLFENGRIDNIFTDTYYEKFTDCLDEVAKKFATLYDSQYIVTRVEEEHLWESKQLGAHSPHVLLSTLMFFNTKHFNLVTVEEHMQLSFSHIMKHWKRNPNTPGVAKVPGSRNVLLRFYPPQSALEANSRKKKVYEQQENEENPLRCPVKLYEFYLSKCPESVKTRNDVFYLLPERSCVPDSPVWYSTMALGKEPLMKMLHRVKMVKEINIALLTC